MKARGFSAFFLESLCNSSEWRNLLSGGVLCGVSCGDGSDGHIVGVVMATILCPLPPPC